MECLVCLSADVERSVPGKPSYVRTRTFSESVMVSWMSPDDGDLVRGYMVGYGEGVPDVNWRYVDAASNNVTIGNLSTCQTRPRDSCAFTHLHIARLRYMFNGYDLYFI